jgi:hypothetical protein
MTMTAARTILILSFVGVFGMSACRGKPTCLDCEDAAEAEDNDASPLSDLPPLPDLPCGGADLLTDNLNCGTCGHECGLWYVGTEYEAGTCKEGECGPVWSSCIAESINGDWVTCSDICLALGENCMANGCSGLTGMMFDVIFGNGCGDFPPIVTLTGGCNQPIPWMTPTENHIEVACCCDFQ